MTLIQTLHVYGIAWNISSICAQQISLQASSKTAFFSSSRPASIAFRVVLPQKWDVPRRYRPPPPARWTDLARSGALHRRDGAHGPLPGAQLDHIHGVLGADSVGAEPTVERVGVERRTGVEPSGLVVSGAQNRVGDVETFSGGLCSLFFSAATRVVGVVVDFAVRGLRGSSDSLTPSVWNMKDVQTISSLSLPTPSLFKWGKDMGNPRQIRLLHLSPG